MNEYFINNNFKNEIKINVINEVFPKLDNFEQNLLLDYLIKIIDVVSIKFNFDLSKRTIYENQFRQNNYRDSIGFLLMLLPFIDDSSGEKKKKLTSLNELYTKKEKVVDINKTEPKYIYSNLQYGRCIRNKNNIEE